LENIARKIVDSAYTVHKNLGPGLFEKVYEIFFCHELSKHGIKFTGQIDIPIVSDGIFFDEGLRLDVLKKMKLFANSNRLKQLILFAKHKF
jgi:GxxExxY protein